MTDRELTGDEAQRALSEAMRRTLATVPDPTPAELIAFVRDVLPRRSMLHEHEKPLYDALLTVLEGRRQDEHDDSTRSVRPDEPSAFSIHAPTNPKR